MLFVAFPLLAFNIYSFCLIFTRLFHMCLGVLAINTSPWVYSVWDSLGFLDLGGYFLHCFREVSNYYLLKYFLMAFLFVFFFWYSYDLNVGVLNIVPEVSEIILISFNSFFLSASNILSSTSLILSSDSVILLLVPSRVF